MPVAAAAHFFGALVLFVLTIGVGMSEFDDPRPRSLVGRLLNAVLMLWCLPLVTPLLKLGIRLPIPVQWITFFANSALWGRATFYIVKWLMARQSARPPRNPLS